jgi:DNA (cytosine-5)-methyltransferase 1
MKTSHEKYCPPRIFSKPGIPKVRLMRDIAILNHGKDDTRSHSIEKPMPTLTTVDAWGIVDPFIVRACHGEHDKGAWPIGEPLRTVTTKDQFALVEPDKYRIDIRFRMLQPHELARAMSFPDDYHFAGNRESKVKQIGNAVPVNLAAALCCELLKDFATKTKAA